jgi:cytochrome P450
MTIDHDPAHEAALETARTYNPFDAAFLENEFETYDQMREHCPIVHSEAAGSAGTNGSWVLTRYDQSCDFLQDHATYSNQNGEYPVRPWIPQAIDPPAHTAYRRIMNPWFTVDAMRPLEPHLDEFADELVTTMLENDSFDFVAEFADPFPTKIFCELAGFPLEDYPQIMDWKNTLMHCADGHSGGEQLAKAMGAELGFEVSADERMTPDVELAVRAEVGQRIYGYLMALVERRRTDPKDGLVTWLLNASYDGERPLTDDELVDTLFLFYMAGLDTVASALGLIVQYFAENPEKRREFVALMEDEEKVAAAVEELVRVHAIVLLPRRVTGDTDFHGVSFSENDQVLCPTMAANRDPDEFENPNDVQFDRVPNRHIGFGLGPHRCIGIHLARRELRIALQVFHRKCPDYRLQDGAKAEAFAGMKGLASLPLVKS